MSSNSARQGGRRWLLRLTLLMFGLSLLTGVLLWQWMATSSLIAVQGNVASLMPVFTAFRVLLIGLVALFWPKLVAWFSEGQQFETATREHHLALRWRVVTWLFILELVLGQNLPGRFFVVLRESVA